MSPKHARSVVTPKARSAVRLGGNLERNLLAYAAAAGAGLLTASQPADAQIVYTPSNIPMTFARQNQGLALTKLDLNNDGNPDFTFGMLSVAKWSYYGTTSRFKFYLKLLPNQTGNQILQGKQASTAAAVPAGKQIGPQDKFAPGGAYLQFESFDFTATRNSGTWEGIEYAYVGLKFLIDGQVHYGWARIKFPSPASIVLGYPGSMKYGTISGYAYESTPDKPIVAGQTNETPKETVAAGKPATLGMLAAGAPGVNLWRSRNSANDGSSNIGAAPKAKEIGR